MVSVIRKIVQAPLASGVKAYGEFDIAGNMSIEASAIGAIQNDFGVEILDDISSPAEAIVWTPNRLTLHIEAGTSTITLILAAGGGITGTPWGTIAAIAAGGTKPGAMALTAMRNLPNAVLGVAPSSVVIDMLREGGQEFAYPVLMVKHILGGDVTISLSQSNVLSASKAYGEKNKLSITALNAGKVYNEYSVVMQNTVGAGSETIAWTKNSVTISKAATSTVAQVIAAAGGVTGTPWGVVGKAATAALTDVSAGTLVSTAIQSLDNFVGGDDAGTIIGSPVTVSTQGHVNIVPSDRVDQFLNVSALAALTPAEIELNVVANA